MIMASDGKNHNFKGYLGAFWPLSWLGPKMGPCWGYVGPRKPANRQQINKKPMSKKKKIGLIRHTITK